MDAMTGEPPPPPLRWLFGDADQRRIAGRYWLRDPMVGAAELALHYAMRAMPIDMCSYSGAAITYLTRRLYPDSDARARKAWAVLRDEGHDPIETRRRERADNLAKSRAQQPITDNR